MIRRSRLEIYFDVLKTVEDGNTKPTLIMYSTNISWTMLNEVLETLTRKGFITLTRESKRKRSVKITEKGIRALWHYSRSLELLIRGF